MRNLRLSGKLLVSSAAHRLRVKVHGSAHPLRLAKLVERIERLVQPVEYPILTHRPGKVAPFQVGLQVRLHVGQH